MSSTRSRSITSSNDKVITSQSHSNVSNDNYNANINDDESDTPPYPIVRRRISKACNYCRQRKIKCNGNTPCLNCKSHHIDCIYSKTVRKKKKQVVAKVTLQGLEKRLNKMDTKFELLNDKVGEILQLLQKKKFNIDELKDDQYQKVDGRKFNKGRISKPDKLKQQKPASLNLNQVDYNEDNDDNDNDDNDNVNDNDEESEDDEESDDDSNLSNDGSIDEETNNEVEEYEYYDEFEDQTKSQQLGVPSRYSSISSSMTSYPISPVESEISIAEKNPSHSVMTPISIDSSSSYSDNFSFANFNNDGFNSQFTITNNIPHSSIDLIYPDSNKIPQFTFDLTNAEHRLNNIYSEIPSIATHLENDLL